MNIYVCVLLPQNSVVILKQSSIQAFKHSSIHSFIHPVIDLIDVHNNDIDNDNEDLLIIINYNQ